MTRAVLTPLAVCICLLGSRASGLGDVTADKKKESAMAVDDPLERIAALRRQIHMEEPAVLELLRQCDEQIDGFQQTPPKAQTFEGGISRVVETKHKAISALVAMRSRKGIDYAIENFFYAYPWGRNEPDIFLAFPCASKLAHMTDEPTAVRAVVHLAKISELTPDEHVFCARFLYHIARNPDRQNALGKNLVLKEVEDLSARIAAAKKVNPSAIVGGLERQLKRLERNVQGILVGYNRILENDERAMQEFYDARAKMIKASAMKWKASQPRKTKQATRRPQGLRNNDPNWDQEVFTLMGLPRNGRRQGR